MGMVYYPSELPAPSAAPTQSAERRLVSPDGGPFESRSVQRDRLLLQQLTFPPMTREQSDAFESFWAINLKRGGAWFAADWPLPQGMVAGVRRFVTTPQWQFVAAPNGGLWRVAATVEVRGRGLIPTDCLSESFASGLDPYHLVSGTLGAFSVVDSPRALRTTATSAADSVSLISRPVMSHLCSTLALRFRLRSVGSDDACLAAAYFGNQLKLALNPIRETFYDGSRRPHLYLGASDYPIGTSSLSIGVMYEMELVIQENRTAVCTITNLDSSSVVAQSTINNVDQPTIDSLGFYVDAASPGSLSETDYFFVHVC